MKPAMPSRRLLETLADRASANAIAGAPRLSIARGLDRHGALCVAALVTWMVVGAWSDAAQVATARLPAALGGAVSDSVASHGVAPDVAATRVEIGPVGTIAMSTAGPETAAGTEQPGAPSPTDAILARESVLGAYSGVSYTHPSDTIEQRPGAGTLRLDDVEWIGLPYRNPIYYGLRVAHWPQGLPLGAMLDFTHAKAVARDDQTVTVTERAAQQPGTTSRQGRLEEIYEKLEFSHGHNLLLLNGLVRLPFATAKLSPYVGAGLGGSVPHVEIQRAGSEARTYGYQLTGWAAQGLVGVELRLSGMSVFVEYKFTFSPYRPELRDGQGGALATDLATHHAIGGFNIRLAH